MGMVSLGCAKNLVDAEIMLGALLQQGVQITNDAAHADAVIINTCSFIDAAQEESVDAVLQSAALRRANDRHQALIVAGCLPQRFRDDLPRLLPEVDAFMGIDQVAQVAEIVKGALAKRAARSRTLPKTGHRKLAAPSTPWLQVNPRPTFIPDFATPRFRLTPRHFAYLKIAEGCNHPCSFCIIPRMRGSHRSRPQPDVVAEARRLLDEGVKELNLISQDSTYYGLDLRAGHSRAIASPVRFNAAVQSLPARATTICTLLRELNALPGDFWIRLLYTHPAHWTGELIRTIAECPKVARYADIPLQHIHDNMLERMRRETSRQYIVELLQRIRSGIAGIALRTTFIVGFPGETEACFEDLLGFIRETKFERLGVFTYSQEEGTRAGRMAGQIRDKLKQQRRARAMAEQDKVARAVAGSCVGRELRVLVEGKADARHLPAANVNSWEHGSLREANSRPAAPGAQSFSVARGEADAPDIDGRVFVRGSLPIGQFARVKITGHTDYDLIGEGGSSKDSAW